MSKNQVIEKTSENARKMGSPHRVYPAYKPSAVAWLGDIPAHWEVKRLKYIARLLYGDSLAADNREDGEFAVFGSNGKVGTHTRANTLAPALIIGRKGSFGKVNYSAQSCFAIDTTFLIDRRSTKTDVRWLFYAIPLLGLDTISQDSTVPGLSREFAYEQWLPVPSAPEQRAIAAYLDRETARIDALVARNERLIELLQEKRTALISHAVTRGLDANAPLKDSGVAWLGNVPKHWEVKRLLAVARLQRGHDLTNEQRREGDVPVISSSGFSGYHDTAKMKGPGVATGRYGTVGEIYYIEQDYWPMNTALYVNEFNGNHPRYIFYLLKLLPYDAYSGKAAVPGIDRNDLHPLLVVCPLLNEQRAIAAYLDRETAKIDALVGKVYQVIEKLQEYRTALISAAVTGKIDVRETPG